MNNFFQKNTPLIALAPLAGISDYPFRIVNCLHGADLCYEEMISACALLYDNKKTISMVESSFKADDWCQSFEEKIDFRKKLGVQVVGKNASNISKALGILHQYPFYTFDINMGCPVPKVTRSGSGSAMLKDITTIDETLELSRSTICDRPLSVKIRSGWDHSSINALSVCQLAQKHSLDFICIHGRTRSDNYSNPVNLDIIQQVVTKISLPVLANGNIFSDSDMSLVLSHTHAQGVLIGRASLGNPWIFEGLKSRRTQVSIDEWFTTVTTHLQLQKHFYKDSKLAAILMRKYLIWYIKGWDGAKVYKDKFNKIESIDEGLKLVDEFYKNTPKDSKRNVFLLAFDKDRFSFTPST